MIINYYGKLNTFTLFILFYYLMVVWSSMIHYWILDLKKIFLPNSTLNLTYPIGFPVLYNIAFYPLIYFWWLNSKQKVPIVNTLRLLIFLISIKMGKLA